MQASLLEIIFGLLQLVAVAFVAVRFFFAYQRTQDKMAGVLTIIFTFLTILFVPHIVVHDLLGMHYIFFPWLTSEVTMSGFFLITLASLVWALWPRPGWRTTLKK